jgi:hypothetical protein
MLKINYSHTVPLYTIHGGYVIQLFWQYSDSTVLHKATNNNTVKTNSTGLVLDENKSKR